MSRSGYTDDCDDRWSWICWRGAVASAIRGKRGQAFLRETLSALDALPERKLIRHDLIKLPRLVERWDQRGIWFWDIETELESVCTLGAVGLARNLDMTVVDPEDQESVAALFGIPHTLACEIMYLNDEHWFRATPEELWSKMREWVASEIRDLEPSA